MCSKVNKANKEEMKHAAVYDYNWNTGAIHLRDQILQTYLLEQNESSKWYMKLFRRLLNVR
jgi:hypothetical protein